MSDELKDLADRLDEGIHLQGWDQIHHAYLIYRRGPGRSLRYWSMPFTSMDDPLLRSFPVHATHKMAQLRQRHSRALPVAVAMSCEGWTSARAVTQGSGILTGYRYGDLSRAPDRIQTRNFDLVDAGSHYQIFHIDGDPVIRRTHETLGEVRLIQDRLNVHVRGLAVLTATMRLLLERFT